MPHPHVCFFTFPLQSETGTSESSTAVLFQIRLIDVKRLRRMIGYVSEPDCGALKQKLKALLP
jgi:mRNA-degrading endonuclease toxin of MazEF toxin-antitoxin module